MILSATAAVRVGCERMNVSDMLERHVGQDLESVSRAFLHALDEGRWMDAAALVDPRTREALQAWSVEHIRTSAGTPPFTGPSDTRFFSASEVLGLRSEAEAACLTSTSFLARFAEGVSPANFLRMTERTAAKEVRIIRTFLDATHTVPDRATVRYRAEWWHGDQLDEAVGGIHSLELVLRSDGWRVRDADLSGQGGGHILPPQ
ncbi:MAG TPA: hypothetical protein VF006_25225 [Longimicrobium sp.]